ncbi:putative sulfatase [Haloferax mucosum ATCC BAA-1512]|uniref:Putative sulfatase n=1 Tax=Haloferax mucosum ATCC BAA-1512 TaxID=662479 RepID=M0IQ87_9EURY|nr:sulfatase [Haloferax mucosum]ELZ98895.1 putative sulfatase [Haloferax mucosum ATCC BAA-1512]
MVSPRHPNVVLLIFDTLRVDALSCYSDDAVETPNIDRVAEEGVRFENAFSAGPWTPPAHGTLFSGRWPSETGFTGGMPWMDESVPLLAEVLRDNGYDTVGVPGPAKMASATGLDRGFDWYYEAYEAVAKRPSAAWFKQLLTDPAIRRDFIRILTRGNDYYNELRIEKFQEGLAETTNPFFGMMNLTTVHAPYDPPRPYKEAETPELSRPRLPILEEFTTSGSLDRDDVREDRVFGVADGEHIQDIRLRYLDDRSYVTDSELGIVEQWYDASVRYLDDQVGRVLDWLEAQGKLDDTVLILTSDHGEYFGEHGGLSHGDFLYDEVLHVPLLISGPGVPSGETREDLVSLADVFATVCGCCDVECPPTSGIDLFGDEARDVVFGERAPTDERELAAADDVSAETVTALELGRKSIRTTDYRFEIRSDGSEALYELPGETVVSDPDPELVESLRDRLVDTLGDGFGGDDGGDREFSDAVERNLRELGYLG